MSSILQDFHWQATTWGHTYWVETSLIYASALPEQT